MGGHAGFINRYFENGTVIVAILNETSTPTQDLAHMQW